MSLLMNPFAWLSCSLPETVEAGRPLGLIGVEERLLRDICKESESSVDGDWGRRCCASSCLVESKGGLFFVRCCLLLLAIACMVLLFNAGLAPIRRAFWILRCQK